jgi:hypothetical protein
MDKTYKIDFLQISAFQALLDEFAISYKKQVGFFVAEFTVSTSAETIKKIDEDWLQELTDQQSFSF